MYIESKKKKKCIYNFSRSGVQNVVVIAFVLYNGVAFLPFFN